MGILDFFVHLGTMTGIYAILALSLNFHYGFSGLVNFGVVGFFAIGAYTSALVTNAGIPFLVGILLSGVAGALLGLVVALPTSKVSVQYWAITTLGVGEIVRLVVTNEEWLTNGSFGIAGIIQPLSSVIPGKLYPLSYMGIVLIFLCSSLFLIKKLSNSPFGRNLKVIREDDELPLALGKSVFYLRVRAMAIGAMIAGIAGSLYAHYITFISPIDFMPTVTFIIWGMVIVGGKGNVMGSVVGAVIIVLFYNSTRYVKDYLPISSATAASLRMVVIGMLMILVVLYKPKGLLKERKKTYRI